MQIDQKVIDAFHLMWDYFPEPVTLVHKSREIMATNPACKLTGQKTGIRCIGMGTPEAHKGCLANQAVDTHKATYTKMGEKVIAYWLPIDGYPEFYVHFGVGVTIDYDAK